MVLSDKLQGLSATELVPGDDSLPETQSGQLISHRESLEMFEPVIVLIASNAKYKSRLACPCFATV